MKYEHINDCWNAIRNAKTEEEVQELFEEFPGWSGSWDLVIQDNGSYIVYNTYEEYGCEQTDKETIYLEDYEELYKMETEDGRYLIGDDIDMDYIHGNIQAGYDVTVYKCEIIDGTDPENEDVDWEWVEDYKA